jgi:hypothetical protein
LYFSSRWSCNKLWLVPLNISNILYFHQKSASYSIFSNLFFLLLLSGHNILLKWYITWSILNFRLYFSNYLVNTVVTQRILSSFFNLVTRCSLYSTLHYNILWSWNNQTKVILSLSNSFKYPLNTIFINSIFNILSLNPLHQSNDMALYWISIMSSLLRLDINDNIITDMTLLHTFITLSITLSFGANKWNFTYLRKSTSPM